MTPDWWSWSTSKADNYFLVQCKLKYLVVFNFTCIRIYITDIARRRLWIAKHSPATTSHFHCYHDVTAQDKHLYLSVQNEKTVAMNSDQYYIVSQAGQEAEVSE